MDLKQLRYFQAIAEEGSMSGASARLHVAQSALSLHVQKLEEHLGTLLFIRHARGVSLTEAGDMLLVRASSLIDEFSRTEDDVRRLGSTPRGEVRLGLPGTIGGILSVQLVETTTVRFPDIRLTIAEAMSGFVLEWLQERRVDLAVLYLRADDARFTSELLLSEELVLLSPPSLTFDEPLAFEDLANLPLILPSPAHGLRVLLDGWSTEAAIDLNPRCEIDSYTNIKELVGRGHGCSVLPLHAVSKEAAAGTLRTVHFAAPGRWREVFLVRRQAGRSGHATDAITHLIRDLMEELVRSGAWTGVRRNG